MCAWKLERVTLNFRSEFRSPWRRKIHFNLIPNVMDQTEIIFWRDVACYLKYQFGKNVRFETLWGHEKNGDLVNGLKINVTHNMHGRKRSEIFSNTSLDIHYFSLGLFLHLASIDYWRWFGIFLEEGLKNHFFLEWQRIGCLGCYKNIEYITKPFANLIRKLFFSIKNY